MPIVRHPKRWWNYCMPEDEKKIIKRNKTRFCKSKSVHSCKSVRR